jgi:hypothetical protein
MWEVATTQVYRQWMARLSDEVKQAVATSALLIAQFGPRLKRPHADTLKGSKHANMKELRVDEGGQVIRIAFAFDPTRRAVLLIGGSKQGVKSKRFYAQLIRRADALYDEYLSNLPKGNAT